jgi:hypothetical protein
MTEIRGELVVRIMPVQLAKDKGNSGTQGQGRAEQAAEHDPIWRKCIGREGAGRRKGDLFLRVRAGVRCDGMGCNNNGMMAWDAIRRPHFAQLAALPCASLHVGKVRSVCASHTTIMGNTRISCYRKDAGVPDCRSPVSLCRVGEVAGCNHACFLSRTISKRGLERALAIS